MTLYAVWTPYDYVISGWVVSDGTAEKPIYVLSSHSHRDHYNPAVFSLLDQAGMKTIRAILWEGNEVPSDRWVLQVVPGETYEPEEGLRLNTFRSTDLGVAFLIEDGSEVIYHAGDLNDWVWEEESPAYNQQMTEDYRRQIRLLSEKLGSVELDTAFVVLDPRQEQDYDRGLCCFLEQIPVRQVFPMHYWGKPEIIERFLQEHPEYREQIKNTESYQ